jgi:hypothetical protein
MNRIIRDNLVKMVSLCGKYRVRRLELFGSASAVGESFDPDSSDLDFLVEFEESGPVEHSRAYFGLLNDLEDLFGRKIDLVETKAISNPYFLESVNLSREVVYAT